jgi:histidinol-phosphate aminotransferase
MSAYPPSDPTTIDDVVKLVRPHVRAERAYHVGTAPDIRVKLNQNESPYDLPADLKRELVEAFLEVPFNRYPSEQPDALRDAIARHEGHPTDGVLVGNGSNELAYTLGLAFVGEGTPVVLPRPLFALYGTMVRIHGGRAVEVGCRPDFRFDVDGLVEAIRRHAPPLTIVATPNNPTGLALPVGDIERIVEAGPGLVVVDEAYVEFNPYGSALGLLERHPNVLVMRTLSKAFGLAGLRVGYLLGHPELMAQLLKARLPFMVDRLAQAAAMALLARPALVAERIAAIRRDTAELTRAMQALDGIEVVPSMTNFVLFRPTTPVPSLMERLADSGVLVRNMGGYPELAGFLRVSTGTPGENRDFMAALKAVLGAEGR